MLEAAGRRLELGGAPLLMGIVNTTPDSFSDAGELPDLDARLARARALAAAGAGVLDIGGESAFGGRPPVPADEEIARVVPVIERIARELDVLISVDTYKPPVAEAAIAAGAHVINDVSGLLDERLADVAAARAQAWSSCTRASRPRARCSIPAPTTTSWPTCATSWRSGWPSATAAGVAAEQLVLDPGPDFAKTPAQTVAILRRLDVLHALGRPLLLPISRKDFLGAITGPPAEERGAATLAAVAWAADAGAHDASRARCDRGRRLPRGPRRGAGRARARVRRGPHARSLPGRPRTR